MAIYLHYLDRELGLTIGFSLEPQLMVDITNILLINTTERLYCGLSLLWEQPATISSFSYINLLLRTGNILPLTSHSSLDDFLETKREQYDHDRNRYPQYFQPTIQDLAEIQLEHVTSHATEAIHHSLVQWSHEPPNPIELRKVKGIRKQIGKILNKREEQAITIAFFRPHFDRLSLPKAGLDLVAKEISVNFVKYYIDIMNGDIATGIPKLKIYDNLSRLFPIFDYEILAKARTLFSFPSFDDKILESVSNMRGSIEHLAYVAALRKLIGHLDPKIGEFAYRRLTITEALGKLVLYPSRTPKAITWTDKFYDATERIYRYLKKLNVYEDSVGLSTEASIILPTAQPACNESLVLNSSEAAMTLPSLLSPASPSAPRAATTSPAESPILPSRTLRTAMQPEGWSGLYVIGCFDRRITFYSQQARALALVRALFEDQDLVAGQRVGIIGGGAAGITAAVAAVSKGCDVVLYEQESALLHLQAQSRHRFLHPHIYDWPRPGSDSLQAGLPLLDWKADYGDKVVASLLLKLEDLRRQYQPRLLLSPKTKITKVEQIPGAGKRVRLVGNQGDIEEDFDVVLISIGFGIEGSRYDSLSVPSYWSGDMLDGPLPGTPRIFISGTGDGGLIDVCRAAISGFRHDKALELLVSNGSLENLKKRLLEIDETAHRQRSQKREDVNLWKEYQRLEIDDSLIKVIKDMKNPSTHVTLNYEKAGIFIIDSALINRLLVLLLIRANCISRELGRVADNGITRVGSVYHIQLEGRPSKIEADIVVPRFGPPKDFFDKTLGKPLADSCRVLAGKLAELGLTGTLDRTTHDWYQT